MLTKLGNHAIPWVDIPRSCIFSPCASTRSAPFTESAPCLPKYVSALSDGSFAEVLSLLSVELSVVLSEELSVELSVVLSKGLSVELSVVLSEELSVELSVELLSGALTLPSVDVDEEETDELVDVSEDPPELAELSEQPQSKAAASTAANTVLPNVFIFIKNTLSAIYFF